MNVLLVAPRIALDVDNEVQRIINSLHQVAQVFKLLLGPQATLLTVVDALAGQHYDLVVFLSHGTIAGIQLADGIASAADLQQILRGARVRCVFLNTCESVGVAIRLHDDVKSAAIIATIGEVDNDVATITGALFAQHVAAGATWREAYELSKPGDNKTYVYINDQMVGDDVLMMIEEIRKSSRQLQDIFRAELLGVRSRLSDLEKSRRPSFWRRLSWTVGFVLWSYVAYPLAYDGVHAALGVSERESLIIGVCVLALSGVLMLRALWDE